MPPIQKITPCLWFDDQAAQAAKFYTEIFKNSRINKVSRYGKEGYEIHHRPEGSVMTVAFELDGQAFTALNGGPVFKLNEAISFQVDCATQEEVDYYWEKLSAHPESEQCGWLKDKFGVSWQIIPTAMNKLFSDKDKVKAKRAQQAMLKMKKLDLKKLRAAFDGK